MDSVAANLLALHPECLVTKMKDVDGTGPGVLFQHPDSTRMCLLTRDPADPGKILARYGYGEVVPVEKPA
jgi:hypothetical protein